MKKTVKKSFKENNMELKETTALMNSKDYKDRFKAEYYQTKIRYEKLRKLTAKMEVKRITDIDKIGFEPTCPYEMLKAQQCAMNMVLHILEQRAIIEGIEL